jgi:sodium/hydrogen exchanger 8
MLLVIVSLLIGIAVGLLASYAFTKLRFVSVSAIKETLLIFCFGYLAYTLADLAQMSGIISMLTSSVMMAHYGWYSLSPQGKHVSSTTFEVIGLLAESFVFVYMGLSFFSYVSYEWSPEFILIEFFTIVIGRFIGTVMLVHTLYLCKIKPQVTLK